MSTDIRTSTIKGLKTERNPLRSSVKRFKNGVDIVN